MTEKSLLREMTMTKNDDQLKRQYLSILIEAQDELHEQTNEVDFISMGLMGVFDSPSEISESVACGISSLLSKHVTKLEEISQMLETLTHDLRSSLFAEIPEEA